MKTRDIKNALRSRIAGSGTTLPINWPNEQGVATTPRLEVGFTTQRRSTPRLKGGPSTRFTGVLLMQLVTAENDGSGNADDFADTFAELFNAGLRLPITGGTVEISDSAEVREGFETKNREWSVPIVATFRALAP